MAKLKKWELDQKNGAAKTSTKENVQEKVLYYKSYPWSYLIFPPFYAAFKKEIIFKSGDHE